MSISENPWETFDSYDPASFRGKESTPVQWPIKLWKAPKVSPYYHKAHLLIAADCSAFSYPGFHEGCAAGKVPLICCPDTDFDIMSRLSDILKNNDILSITIVKMSARCCEDLYAQVRQAIQFSHVPVPVQFTNIIAPGENMDEDRYGD